ncbi:hypothetical protein EJB05_23981 [Eragrostis curvula]|uniref:Uncharacterized protein n=1 Tax=Eragrostis curvula TaxID=38414 RepID=A0A5J9VA18_9POAL|nr:hypothetical protein EJB05_23981 [Eragrostis curvula]
MSERKRRRANDGADSSQKASAKKAARRAPGDPSVDPSLSLLQHGGVDDGRINAEQLESQAAAGRAQEEEQAVARQASGRGVEQRIGTRGTSSVKRQAGRIDVVGSGKAPPPRKGPQVLARTSAALKATGADDGGRLGTGTGRPGEVVRVGAMKGGKNGTCRRRLIDEYDMAQTNKAVERAIGEYVPTIMLNQHRQPSLESLPPRLAFDVQQQAPEALQLDLGVNQTGKSTVIQEINDRPGATAKSQQQATKTAAAGQPVPSSGGMPGLPHLPQPEHTCPRCQIGRGTVAQRHLCRCMQCPDGPWAEYRCPFCELVAVPLLKRPLNIEGTCPCCCTRSGIAAPGHLCVCNMCRNIPDGDCRHCDLARVSQPRPRPEGTCPCCLFNTGRVSTRHLCLCEDCKKVPEAVCPYCLLDDLCVASVAFSVLVFYSLSFW